VFPIAQCPNLQDSLFHPKKIKILAIIKSENTSIAVLKVKIQDVDKELLLKTNIRHAKENFLQYRSLHLLPFKLNPVQFITQLPPMAFFACIQITLFSNFYQYFLDTDHTNISFIYNNYVFCLFLCSHTSILMY